MSLHRGAAVPPRQKGYIKVGAYVKNRINLGGNTKTVFSFRIFPPEIPPTGVIMADNKKPMEEFVLESVEVHVLKDMSKDYRESFKLIQWMFDRNMLRMSAEILIIRVEDLPEPIAVPNWGEYFLTKPRKGTKVKMYQSRRYGFQFPTLKALENGEDSPEDV